MIYSGSLSSEISKREIKNYELALKLALEGMVLLENDGTLPLKDNKIALYGLGAKYTCFGGTGSGEVRSRFKISIYEGLKKCGFTILTEEYLSALDSLVTSERKKWETALKEGVKKTKLMNILDYAGAHPFIFAGHQAIEKSADTNVALYIIRREAGEGADRRLTPGDMYLSAIEKEDINLLNQLYEKVVVIINSPGAIEDIKDIKANAIIYTGLSGMMLGEALGQILNGDFTPCGHLAVTWAKRGNYPLTYDYNNPLIDEYNEGIFVGYRYFSTFNKEVIYPFGYGLSYTKFMTNFLSLNTNDLNISMDFLVENKGLYSGKEVVGVYLTTPDVDKEKYQLVGFAKTDELAPNEKAKVSITFSLRDFASYQDGKMMLAKGAYLLSLGLNVKEVKPLCYLTLEDDVLVTKVKALNTPIIKNLKANNNLSNYDLPSYVLTTTIEPKPINYQLSPIVLTPKAENVFAKLSIKDKMHLLVGSSYLGKPYFKTFGAAGNSSAKFSKLGLYNLVLADGPQGLNLQKESLKPIFKSLNFPVLPEALYLTNIGKLLKLRKIKKDSNQAIYYQFTTNFPSASVIAQTFNLALVEAEGKAIQAEMKEYNVNFLLAPGVNIIRDPLGGRNYEYYSEDPYLSGMLATSLAKGVESQTTHITLKHFACNNRENERVQISSNVDEKTLREIYLKPFELAITKTPVGGVMSSYNKINGLHTANSYTLLTTILREEWGFKGIVMTDWFATGHDDSTHEEAIKAGTNLIMPGLPKIRKQLYKAYKAGQIKLTTIDYLVKEYLSIACK